MGGAKLVSFFLFSGVEILVHLAIVAFAFLAAWRHRLTGIWILTGAAILALVQTVGWILIAPPLGVVRHENLIRYANAVGCFRYAVAVVALCGWCALALTRRPKAGPTARDVTKSPPPNPQAG
jgi:hypothetical protein